MPDTNIGNIESVSFSDTLAERYLAYALSATMSRSLPDVRDGLKPVHRRLVYAMMQLKLDPGSGYKKCARVVGDVMGKFHPHGDSSIYEALVRLAQDFASRYPLVDGQGNFGNIDGDNPAAMRYTESRLTAVAAALMEGIDEDAVDFRPIYDNEEREPVVLPAAFPNLLANGATGIAVGMATSIPPHNVREVCRAAHHLIHYPSASVADLLALMPAPDFPTGGQIVDDPAALCAIYETGRGAIRLRARWSREELDGGAWQVVVTEIPYQVQKSALIEQIANLLENKKVPLLGDVRDESSDVVRIVLEPKSRGVDPELLMASLFRASNLETRFNFNMNVLDANRTPRVMGLREILQAWLDHRHEVLERRSRHRLEAIARRLEILNGYLIVYVNLDEVIRIIREEDEPKPALMTAFGLTEVQAEAILNMRLRSLRRLDEISLRNEHERLTAEQARLHGLLASADLRWAAIASELEGTADRFRDPRRSLIAPVADVDEALPAAAVIEKEPVTVMLTQMGWIRAVRGHVAVDALPKVKDGDALHLICHCQTTDRVTLLAAGGRVFSVGAGDLPRGRGDGQALRLLIDLDIQDSVLTMFVPDPGQRYLLARSDGRGFVTAGTELSAERKAGKVLVVTQPEALVAFCKPVTGDHVVLVGENGKMLAYPVSEIPQIQRGAGAILQRYKSGGLRDLQIFNLADGFRWVAGGAARTEANSAYWVAGRATQGKAAPKKFPVKDGFGLPG